MNQPKMYIRPLPPEPPSHLPQSIGFELSASYSKFPLAVCFTYSNVYVSALLSQFVPSSPLTVSTKSVLCVCISFLNQVPLIPFLPLNSKGTPLSPSASGIGVGSR